MKQEIINLKRCGFNRSRAKRMMLYVHPILCPMYLDKFLDAVYG